MRKKAWIGAAILLAVVLVLGAARANRVVGTLHGAEWETLTVGETQYERDSAAPYHRSDRGGYLGMATDGKTRLRLYAVRGDENYLYAVWEWEGLLYRRVQ